MKKLIIFALLALGTGCAKQPVTTNNTDTASTPAPAASSASAPAPTPQLTTRPAPEEQTLPAGTQIPVRLDGEVGSAISHSGDRFTATVERAIESNGQVVIPKGAAAEGVVADAQARGKFKGGALLRLRLESVRVGGTSYPVAATISRSMAGKGKRSAVAIGGGAGLGALIGGIAGGGKGAAIGAVAGGGAGTAGAAFTGNKEIVLPAETAVTFELAKAAVFKK